MKKLELIYAGKRLAKGNTIIHAWFNPSTEHEGFWKKNLVSWAPIGAQFQFTVTDDDSVHLGGENKPIHRQTIKTEQTAQWEAASMAAENQYDLIRQQTRIKDNGQIEIALAPIKRLIAGCRRQDRSAFYKLSSLN